MTAYLLSLLSVFHLAKADPVVTFRARSLGGPVSQSYFNFRSMSQDPGVTKNRWDLRFDAVDGGNDQFNVNTSVASNSFIYWLGEKHCFEVASMSEDLRKSNPMKWLADSPYNPGKLKNPSFVSGIVNHSCYLIYDNDDRGRLVALFYVKELETGVKATISEIEILEDLRK